MEPARIAPAPHPASAPQPAQPSSGKTFDKAAAGTPTQAGAQGAGSFAALLLALGACRALGVDSENAPQRAQFLPDSPPHSGAMGQEAGKKWAAAAHSQPTIPKSDRLLDGAAAQPTDTPAFGQDALGGIAANSASAPDDGALDVAVAMADPAALAAWQGALSGQHVQGTAQGTAGGAAGDGTNGTAKEGLLAGVGRGMAFDAPATIAQPHGLVAQTAQLDRAADATDLQGFQGQQGPQAAQALRRTLARSAAQAGLADSAAAQAGGDTRRNRGAGRPQRGGRAGCWPASRANRCRQRQHARWCRRCAAQRSAIGHIAGHASDGANRSARCAHRRCERSDRWHGRRWLARQRPRG